MIEVWWIRCTWGTFGRQMCAWRSTITASVSCRPAQCGRVGLAVVASQGLVASSTGGKPSDAGCAALADSSLEGAVWPWRQQLQPRGIVVSSCCLGCGFLELTIPGSFSDSLSSLPYGRGAGSLTGQFCHLGAIPGGLTSYVLLQPFQCFRCTQFSAFLKSLPA